PARACCPRPAEMPPAPIDQDRYRRLSDLITAGLAVMTTRQGSHDVAVTVDSYLDVSYDPPTMLVALYGMSRAAEAVEVAGFFCLNVLTEDQQYLAFRFVTPSSPLIGLFSGLEFTRTFQGGAVLVGSLAHFAIRIEQAVDAATHRLLI